MAQLSTATARVIETVDLSPLTADPRVYSVTDRLRASEALVAALHGFGFAKVIGHGISKDEIREALGWTKGLFDLHYNDKMKAPHPPGPMPHRGYSPIGKEKVYSQADVKLHKDKDSDVGQSLRKINDYKESYEIGSEHDPIQQNIWIPDDVLPGFKEYMTSWYKKLATLSKLLLDAIGVGLGLEPNTKATRDLRNLISDRHCQLRLLHYPPISRRQLETELLARLPAHNDWGTFTLLFQDDNGGLELQDAHSQEYLHATPEEGAFIINIGDMLQRFTNGSHADFMLYTKCASYIQKTRLIFVEIDYFVSALHRVSVPSLDNVPSSGLPARYSIPFFVCPDFSATVSTLPKFVEQEVGTKYKPVRFDEYGSIISKYQYSGDESQ